LEYYFYFLFFNFFLVGKPSIFWGKIQWLQGQDYFEKWGK